MSGRILKFDPNETRARELQRLMNEAATPADRVKRLLTLMTPAQQVILTNLALAMVEAREARLARIGSEGSRA